jgi:AraC-like DNA-binding protein
LNNTTLHSDTSGAIAYTDIVPVVLLAYALEDVIPVVASGPFGDFLFQVLHSPEVDLWYNNYRMVKDDSFISSSELPRLEMQFVLSNSFSYDGEGLGKREMRDGSFNFVYVPFVYNQMSLEMGRVYTTFDIRFTPEYLTRMAAYFPVLNEFLEKVARKEASVLCELNQLTSIHMKNIIYDILNNPYTGNLMQFYINNKVMEMLIITLEKIATLPTVRQVFFRKEDIEKIYAAKDELLTHIDKPVTLMVLSRKVGLNVHKLKNGFLQFYGSSVSVYLLDARMKKAKTLLDDTDGTIQDIAYATGYSNAQHFSKAYKKYYRHTPTQYRKESYQR